MTDAERLVTHTSPRPRRPGRMHGSLTVQVLLLDGGVLAHFPHYLRHKSLQAEGGRVKSIIALGTKGVCVCGALEGSGVDGR